MATSPFSSASCLSFSTCARTRARKRSSSAAAFVSARTVYASATAAATSRMSPDTASFTKSRCFQTTALLTKASVKCLSFLSVRCRAACDKLAASIPVARSAAFSTQSSQLRSTSSRSATKRGSSRTWRKQARTDRETESSRMPATKGSGSSAPCVRLRSASFDKTPEASRSAKVRPRPCRGSATAFFNALMAFSRFCLFLPASLNSQPCRLRQGSTA
mmetsp:Transcript_115522/g.274586  ORF Transcript_115522/g.274586 Transcript_115522/m.274586 type:complete len:218 (-) Transcript_115522:329-982(-)